MGIEVIAIDDTDSTGWLESATTIGEVTFTSLSTFVSSVVGYLNGRTMKLLHVQVHGSPTRIVFGRDSVNLAGVQTTHRATLGRLTTCFDTEDPWVDLRACNIGQKVPFLQSLASLWRTTVVAGRGSQNNILDVNFGRYVIVKPDGTSETSFFAPREVDYNLGRRIGRQIRG
jgi:hypothetical protein